MGVVEELEDTDAGECPVCTKVAENKRTACKAVFYCSRDCQKKHWKTHKFDCKSLPFKVYFKLTEHNCLRDKAASQLLSCNISILLQVGQSKELGKYVTAARDLKAGEVLFTEAPLVVGPVQMTQPVCLSCYTPVDGSFK